MKLEIRDAEVAVAHWLGYLADELAIQVNVLVGGQHIVAATDNESGERFVVLVERIGLSESDGVTVVRRDEKGRALYEEAMRFRISFLQEQGLCGHRAA